MPNEDVDTRIGRVRNALQRGHAAHMKEFFEAVSKTAAEAKRVAEQEATRRGAAFKAGEAEVVRIAEEAAARQRRLEDAHVESVTTWLDRADALLQQALKHELEARKEENTTCIMLIMNMVRPAIGHDTPIITEAQSRQIVSILAGRWPKAARPRVPHTADLMTDAEIDRLADEEDLPPPLDG